MVRQFRAETVNDVQFRLLSVATLLEKVYEGISIEELYRDAERKFDTLIELLSDTYTDNTIVATFGYSLNDLKQVSMSIFNLLISDTSSNPYMTLCVLEDASLDEIKRRRNKLLHIFHPDRNREESADGTKAGRINAAYERIVSKYDKTDMPFMNTKTYIPPSYPCNYPYKKRPYEKRLTLFFIIMVSIIAFLGFMKFILF
jgi:hypothetical protein